MSSITIRLLGGPVELRERERVVETPSERLAVPFRAGYEHFQRVDGQMQTDQDQPVLVYVWQYRTMIAE